MNLIDFKQSEAHARVTIKLPHMRYVDRILKSSSYEELMWLFMRAGHPAKEISESCSALSNLQKVVNLDDRTIVHIGDGAYARTGGLFAFFSKSTNFSVDPALNMEKMKKWREKYSVKNLFLAKSKFESIDFSHINDPIITLVHAHVGIRDVIEQIPHFKLMYTNPCCQSNRQNLHHSDVEFMRKRGIQCIMNKQDMGILSEKRSIFIYERNTQKKSG